MLHLRHSGLAVAASLAVAAVSAAPAAAMVSESPHLLVQQAQPSTPTNTSAPSTSPCSEVCSGGAVYRLTSFRNPRHLEPSTPATPSPCSEVCSGGSVGATLTAVSTPRTLPTVVHVVTHNSGFDWGDAGIGAGAAALLLLIIGGGLGATATRRGRRLGGSSATVAG